MNVLKHTPKPLIEEHYHLEELINAQEKRTEDRIYHRNRIKELEDRDDLIKDSKPVTITDFYCDKCAKDFKAQAVRIIELDWTNTKQKVAYYKTKCYNGHWTIRLITDKHKDGFFLKSRLSRLDQGNHTQDIIQPFETNYNLVYGK